MSVQVLEVLFWSSIGMIVYAYFGYPLLLAALSLVRRKAVATGAVEPTVSFIITAYNEERRIREKIQNSLALRYPRERLDIVVASDCSTDRTDEIVKAHAASGVRLVRAPIRKGKEAAQRWAVQETSGEILVFSDVATILPENAISNIVRNFHDPTVGCVSSVDRFVDQDGRISGEGAYVKYEMLLRSLETKVNSLVGLSGSFFAARRSVCREWASDLQSDFNTLLNAVRQGLRGVSDPETIGYYRNIADEKKEYDRKVRTVLRGIAVFMNSCHLLNPARYGLFSWQLFSHKLCRWLVPFALIAAFLTSSALAVRGESLYQVTMGLQAAFYGVGILGWAMPTIGSRGVGRLVVFFLVVNGSILDAWFRYWRGERIVNWQPSERRSLDVRDHRVAK